jgi:hypothetical protein
LDIGETERQPSNDAMILASTEAGLHVRRLHVVTFNY